MTPAEAVREAWRTTMTGPIPTTVAECKDHGRCYHGFGAPVGPGDRYGVHVEFRPDRVTVNVWDHHTTDDEGFSTEVARVSWTHREFLELLAEPELTLFGEAS